jgi:hypothetical protein
VTWLWHKLLCAIGRHYGHVVGDASHIWHECAHCGAINRIVERDNVRTLRQAGGL